MLLQKVHPGIGSRLGEWLRLTTSVMEEKREVSVYRQSVGWERNSVKSHCDQTSNRQILRVNLPHKSDPAMQEKTEDPH